LVKATITRKKKDGKVVKAVRRDHFTKTRTRTRLISQATEPKKKKKQSDLAREIVQILPSRMFSDFRKKESDTRITAANITSFFRWRGKEIAKREEISAAMSYIWTMLGEQRGLIKRKKDGIPYIYQFNKEFYNHSLEEIKKML